MSVAAACCMAWKVDSLQAQFPFRRQNNGEIARQLGFLSTRVVIGRVVVTTSDPTRSFRQGDNQEQLAVEFGPDSLSLEYTRNTPDGHSSVRVVDSREVIARQNPSPGQKKQPLLFVQPADGAIQLILGSGEATREIRVGSLWQLYLAEPDTCRKDLFPLLETLRPTWKLAKAAAEIEEKLATWNAPAARVDPAAMNGLVSQLGDPSFAEREIAERRLMAMGPAAAPWLRRFDPARLDAEQRLRVRKVLGGLADNESEDTPQDATVWLASDPQTWLLLLNRDDAKLRRVAVERLEKLLDRKIEFDVDGDEETRRKQGAEIEKLFERE